MSNNETDVRARMMLDPKFIELSIQVMNMDNEDMDLDVIKEEFNEELIKTREGAYGKDIQYVAAQHYRERLNRAFNHRWSFMPIYDELLEEPQYRRYNKDDNEYEWLDGTPYVRVLGALIIPGVGIQMQYGVKKIQGDNEDNAWKAATTDALKKCCEQIGIQVPYDDTDEDYSSGGGNKREGEIDIDNLEYTEEELEDAFDVVVSFGKYKDDTLEDIVDEDPDYVKWIYENAREQDMADAAAIVYRWYLDEEAERKKSKRNKRNEKSSKSSKSNDRNSRNKKSDDRSERKSSKKSDESKSSKTKTTKDSSVKKNKLSAEEQEEMDELIETIQDAFDEDDSYDDVTIQSMIAGISISKQHPQGKTDLQQLTLPELRKLADVLVDEIDDDE